MKCSHTHRFTAGSVCHWATLTCSCVRSPLAYRSFNRLYLWIPEWLVSLQAYLSAEAKCRARVCRGRGTFLLRQSKNNKAWWVSLLGVRLDQGPGPMVRAVWELQSLWLLRLGLGGDLLPREESSWDWAERSTTQKVQVQHTLVWAPGSTGNDLGLWKSLNP